MEKSSIIFIELRQTTEIYYKKYFVQKYIIVSKSITTSIFLKNIFDLKYLGRPFNQTPIK